MIPKPNCAPPPGAICQSASGLLTEYSIETLRNKPGGDIEFSASAVVGDVVDSSSGILCTCRRCEPRHARQSCVIEPDSPPLCAPNQSPDMRKLASLRGEVHIRERDRQAISYHYDISNGFYRLFLDWRMVYSPEYSLDTTQEQKWDYICKKLRLKPGQRLLRLGHTCDTCGVAV